MKHINIIKVMVLAWSTILFTSCSNPAENKTSNIEKPKEKQVAAIDTTIQSKVTSEKIDKEVIDGWLKESIKQQVVIDKIGKPEKKGEDTYLGVTGTYAQTWEYPSLGINLEMESETQSGDKIVLSITIIQPCKLTTSQGIGIGSEAKLVLKRYQKFIDNSNTDSNGIVVGSIYNGTIFTLKDGFVSEIFIGAAAE